MQRPQTSDVLLKAHSPHASSSPTPPPLRPRVLAALFVSDAPTDEHAPNGVMERVEASAAEHQLRVLRDVSVALMNGARRYVFATCVVVEANAEAEAEAEAPNTPDVASERVAAWAMVRGRVV